MKNELEKELAKTFETIVVNKDTDTLIFSFPMSRYPVTKKKQIAEKIREMIHDFGKHTGIKTLVLFDDVKVYTVKNEKEEDENIPE